MGGHLGKRWIQVGFVAVGFSDGGFGIVRDDDLGHSAEELEHPNV